MNLDPAPSPTGYAPLPQWLITAGIVIVTSAGALLPFLPDGEYRTAAQVIIALGAAFGIASQGKRV